MNKKLFADPFVLPYAQIDLKNATVSIRDGSSPINSLDVTIGEGNLTWTERRNVEYTLDRGVIDEVRLGDQVPVEISLDAVWEYITTESSSNATVTVPDALNKTGGAAAWTSTDADACRPYSVDLRILYIPDCGTGDLETITLSDFRWEQHDYDLRAGTFSISGRCNIQRATAARASQTT
jgi:hypothetical protein